MKTKLSKILAVVLSVVMVFSVLPMAVFAAEEEECQHFYTQWEITQEPTCTEKGEKIRTCAICGEKAIAIVPATGHTEKVIPAVEPTCSKSGHTEGVKCSVCGEKLIATEKIPLTGFCDEDEDGLCDECGVTEAEHAKPGDMSANDLIDMLLSILTKVFTGLSENSDEEIFGTILKVIKSLQNFMD